MSIGARSGTALAAALAIAVGAGCNPSSGGAAPGDDGPVVPWDGSTTSCPAFEGSALGFGAPACNGCMADQCCSALGACLGGEAGGGGSDECTTVLTCLVACARDSLGDDSGALTGPQEGGDAATTDAGADADVSGDDGPDCVSACVAAHMDDAGQLNAAAQGAGAVLDCRDQNCNAAGCY
jgi:hypothetical protein